MFAFHPNCRCLIVFQLWIWHSFLIWFVCLFVHSVVEIQTFSRVFSHTKIGFLNKCMQIVIWNNLIKLSSESLAVISLKLCILFMWINDEINFFGLKMKIALEKLPKITPIKSNRFSNFGIWIWWSEIRIWVDFSTYTKRRRKKSWIKVFSAFEISIANNDNICSILADFGSVSSKKVGFQLSPNLRRTRFQSRVEENRAWFQLDASKCLGKLAITLNLEKQIISSELQSCQCKRDEKILSTWKFVTAFQTKQVHWINMYNKILQQHICNSSAASGNDIQYTDTV